MPPLSHVTVAETKPVPAATANGSLMGHDSSVGSADPCDYADDDYTKDVDRKSSDTPTSTPKEKVPKVIVWRNVILFAYLHMASLYGLYLMFTSAKWQTNAFALFLYIASGLGVTAGVHRLWAHRSYKARLPLRILLAFMYTIAFEWPKKGRKSSLPQVRLPHTDQRQQLRNCSLWVRLAALEAYRSFPICENDIYEWCRDHRVHHKYSETDADPHNARRGFFFAHIGWLLCRKHPDVIKKGKSIDLSDLMADPVVRFHRKYYVRLVLLCCFVIPSIVPMYLWNETFLNALLIPTLFRLCFTLNQTWLVNSAAHMWGTKPYDIHINPRENTLVALGAVGEGFHNYHHTFPYDYATSEYGIKYNLTTAFIDVMAWLGLAYDRKTASRAMIKARKLRTGEDSLKKHLLQEPEAVKED